MNLLGLVQQATAEMGLTVPTAVVGNGDVNITQCFALLNALGSELVREHIWQGLDKEYRFPTVATALTGTTTLNSATITGLSSTVGLDTTYQVTGAGIPPDCSIYSVDSASQVTLNQAATASGTVALVFGKTKYPMPSDYDRQIDNTQFDKSKRWRMIGPVTPQQWQWLKSSYVSTGPAIRYRTLGNTLQIWPQVTTADYHGFEYISNAWAVPVTGSNKTAFSLDTDTCLYPDRLMVLGLKKKYFEIKGFDTTAFVRDYAHELNRAKTSDAGSPMLSMIARMPQVLIGINNVPDGGFGP